MKKLTLSLLLVSSGFVFSMEKEEEPCSLLSLKELVALAFGKYAIVRYDQQIRTIKILYNSNVPTLEMRETVFESLETHLKKISKELKIESIFCAIIHGLDRPDIVANHIRFLFIQGTEQETVTYFKDLCLKAQAEILVYFIKKSNKIPVGQLMLVLINNVEFDALNVITRIIKEENNLKEKFKQVLLESIHKRALPFIEQRAPRLRQEDQHLIQSSVWASLLMEQYKIIGSIQQEPPQNLRNEILMLLVLDMGPRSVDNAKNLLSLLVYPLHTSLEELTALNEIFKMQYPRVQELKGTFAEDFSPHAIVENELHSYRLSLASDVIFPLIFTNSAEAQHVIQEVTESEKDTLKILSFLVSDRELAENQKEQFFAGLITTFKPFFKTFDDFADFYYEVLFIYDQLGIEKDIHEFMESYLKQIDQNKAKRIRRIMSEIDIEVNESKGNS